ncbi:Calpain small subunit 2 [Armadillidium nasatum]|uniref:Calpain small subunit 2 n=1 Tax=Armadillidium nasatum TaxID=96803 RepID=A0A5N5TMI5_9CRUS|nr:Calpain small subunit 2 [Armadillidium nasatum]
MITMLDIDRSGKLGLHEFVKLWKNIRVWKSRVYSAIFRTVTEVSILEIISLQNAFKLYDRDSSGHLSGFELREALHSAGYRLNNHISECSYVTLW